MRHTHVAVGLATGLALAAALTALAPLAGSAQTGQERLVVFETFGREA